MTDIVERLEATGGKGQGGPLKKEAADEIRKLRAIIASAQAVTRGPLESVSWWLEGCLNCKTWHWDSLQREAAEQALNEARAALALTSAQCGEG
jgi:hypothetical protein